MKRHLRDMCGSFSEIIIRNSLGDILGVQCLDNIFGEIDLRTSSGTALRQLFERRLEVVESSVG